MRIADNQVLLTGASGGLGRAIAHAMSARGAHLKLTGRRAQVLESLAGELDAQAFAVDLSRAADVDRLLEHVGRVDILIANAGLPASGRLESFTMEQIDRALQVNLRASIALAHALLPGMLERGSGHLLFMSSLAGKVATPRTSVYNATKFGLRGFASALRADLHASGVGVSAIFPGFVSEAGMFADSKVRRPRGVGLATPAQVSDAVIRAIERDRGEIDVAPLPLRAGALLAQIAPETAAGVARRLGSAKVAREMDAAQRDKR